MNRLTSSVQHVGNHDTVNPDAMHVIVRTRPWLTHCVNNNKQIARTTGKILITIA